MGIIEWSIEVEEQAKTKNHFDGKPVKTYSLKLGAKERCDVKTGLTLAKHVNMIVFRLRAQYSKDKKYFETLLPAIEDKLHEVYQPLIGTPRK